MRKGGGSSGKAPEQAKMGALMKITDNWPGLPKGFEGGFDAVLNGGGPFTGACYLFKGDSYVKYDLATDKAVAGYPKKIAGNWPGLPSLFCSDIDAAINGEGAFAGNCYFFKGDSYVKFDWVKDHAVYDAPKKIAGNWPGLPAGFEGDLDAACNGRGPFAGKAFFFKGDAYVRFDWKNDHADAGYPKKIADGWKGLPAEFQKDLSATLEGFGACAGKAYFLKDSEYLSYDWALDRADG